MALVILGSAGPNAALLAVCFAALALFVYEWFDRHVWRNLGLALMIGVSITTGVFAVAKPDILIIDPCKLDPPGSLLWYLDGCFLE